MKNYTDFRLSLAKHSPNFFWSMAVLIGTTIHIHNFARHRASRDISATAELRVLLSLYEY